ncbi:DUF4367 domain-containing protein [Paenibacillus alkalitolerans]|uniref:DUF4367 domain-containing protein n=1 Tax=Paenibacillus alkalitolerans TaxID=2799335 RepID=UPI0018F7077E|nr:DUF4367 domain-containing protein [Paenibacillus alkalitolerans]
MSISDRDIREQLKIEADELLFGNVQFDSRLKDKVLQSSLKGYERPSIKDKFNYSWRRRLSGFAVAAAVAGFLFVVAPSISESPAPPPTTLQDPGEGIQGNVDLPPATGVQPSDTPFKASDGPPSTVKDITWQLQSVEEANEQFGSALFIPSFIPDGYKLQSINASGPQADEVMSVTFSYVSGEGSFELTASELAEPYIAEDVKTVDINGFTGYMKSGETDQSTELHWNASGVRYTLTGKLSEDEALSVARSMAMNNESIGGKK